MLAPSVQFEKYADGLVPAVVQDNITRQVLMVGFMNKAAMEETLSSNKVTFYSRSRKAIWTKGETSGNYLHLNEMLIDCDNDTLLIKATPDGPTCHTGADTCFNEPNVPPVDVAGTGFLQQLEQIIALRKNASSDSSYTASLFARGINKIAQKVGEEAVELVIEAKDDNDELFLSEAADLLFHYLILLQARGYKLSAVTDILQARHKG